MHRARLPNPAAPLLIFAPYLAKRNRSSSSPLSRADGGHVWFLAFNRPSREEIKVRARPPNGWR